MLTVTLTSERTPALVAALVASGAEILEVRPDTPPLEDVYLHFLSGDAS
jgi:hypothetical protein